MSEFKNKNDYSVIIYFPKDYTGNYPKPLKVQFVHNLLSLIKWLENSKYKNWYTMYIYARRSRRLLLQTFKGNFINPFPK